MVGKAAGLAGKGLLPALVSTPPSFETIAPQEFHGIEVVHAIPQDEGYWGPVLTNLSVVIPAKAGSQGLRALNRRVH